MSRLIMWNLMTLDGYFEGEKSWDLAFHQYAWGDELERLSIEQLHNADALLFGRVTYEGMAAYWQAETGEVADLMNTLPKIVFSRTLERADWANSKLVKGNLVDEINALKRQGKRDVFVFGSGGLCAALMEHGLFDEYRLCLVPVVLGRGKLLFEPSAKRLRLKLLESRPLASGSVILRYEPQAEK
jgi:dihydrofolate reductase